MKTYKTTNLRKSIALLFFIVCQISLVAQTVNYTESTNIIANPERGLQKYSITSSDYAITSGANNLPVSTLNSWKSSSDKVTVVYRYFLLDAFLNSDINTTFLNNIQNDFDNVREAGFKIIVRFSYSNAQGTDAQQPIKSQILTHISQLSPILNANKDVIFSHQAGFIGTWGEWYYTNSTEFGTDGNISTAQWANRKEIIDAMLTATPIEVPIQVRYAGIKTNMYGVSQLTEQTAYKNTANARIGFFNDAFLNDWGDQGTYSISSQCENPIGTTDYNYISNETKYLPMTGETNGLSPCDNGFRTTGENAINELDLTNWTTINRDYYTPFWDQVISSNHYNDILKNVGYRFVLNSSTVTLDDTGFDLTLSISNTGFARPFKQRNVYLVIKNTATNAITKELINTDIRTWETTVSITQNFDFQLSGTFQLYLWMPDNETLLETNPDYSIQFANSGTWDSVTGYNDLLQTINLTTLSIADFSLNEYLFMYPNPASDFITIQLKNSDKEKVKIYNTVGKVVKEVLISNNHKLDISKLPNGVYFICLDNNKLSTYKFVKQ
ncbi:DUF4832 domain-containing protein [Aquimarina sp. BL5]|uniref:T9SS type A sorting domain-containing protein n=1 Tax=Aquimarina sp. BL5 TaxID=1714860 RepID=UPI000E491A86|nr:DUF4832 domain-containing protein [Aquimarina sp. BL5]AXT53905.1 DUF4832 domain-containing protein [Aquimarina sp. BL5]RKN00288.1 DUF4832 domain-containing protein [Aquimarina sp. BL5]